MRLAGIRGVLVMGAAGVASGRSGRGDLTLEVSGLAFSGFEPLLPGVVGHDDRSRGVPLMACS